MKRSQLLLSWWIVAAASVSVSCFSNIHHRIKTTRNSYTALQSDHGNENEQTQFELQAQQHNTRSQKHQSRRDFIDTVVSTSLLAGSFVFISPTTTEAIVGTKDNTLAASNQFLVSAAPTITTSPPLQSTNNNNNNAVNWRKIFDKASKKALGGGKAGASAAIVQVLSLMWMRTSMNYQYRYGGTFTTALQDLMADGGIPRLYQGLPFALVQGPLTRFGDTAANVGILALLDSLDATASLPLVVKTAAGSITAGLWRIVVMPIDTSKTVLQVEGSDALGKLWEQVMGKEGFGVLYRGALASAAATAVGHFPWFLTYNFLDAQLPAVVESSSSSQEFLFLSLVRAGILGLCASCVSDCSSNSLRVIKTTKQTIALGKKENNNTTDTMEVSTDADGESYVDIVKMIIEKEGLAGLFGRGLKTRLLINAIQGTVFSVLWKYFQQVGGA